MNLAGILAWGDDGVSELEVLAQAFALASREMLIERLLRAEIERSARDEEIGYLRADRDAWKERAKR